MGKISLCYMPVKLPFLGVPTWNIRVLVGHAMFNHDPGRSGRFKVVTAVATVTGAAGGAGVVGLTCGLLALPTFGLSLVVAPAAMAAGAGAGAVAGAAAGVGLWAAGRGLGRLLDAVADRLGGGLEVEGQQEQPGLEDGPDDARG